MNLSRHRSEYAGSSSIDSCLTVRSLPGSALDSSDPICLIETSSSNGEDRSRHYSSTSTSSSGIFSSNRDIEYDSEQISIFISSIIFLLIHSVQKMN